MTAEIRARAHGWTLLALAALAMAGVPVAAADAQPAVRIVLVGDSTVARDQGWGNAFLARLGAGATGVNLGHNGASSKSYRAMGDWAKALAAHPTHILIQFGHNDMPGKGPERETDAATTFRENLARYVDEARAAGAQPVLVTSLVRRTFRGDRLEDLLGAYAEATIAVARKMEVPLVDLHARSLALVERLGPEGSDDLSPVTADGRKDRTHLSAKGGEVFAGLVAAELAKAVPALAACLTAGEHP
jgi:lysophospholipase L1-like esterase